MCSCELKWVWPSATLTESTASGIEKKVEKWQKYILKNKCFINIPLSWHLHIIRLNQMKSPVVDICFTYKEALSYNNMICQVKCLFFQCPAFKGLGHILFKLCLYSVASSGVNAHWTKSEFGGEQWQHARKSGSRPPLCPNCWFLRRQPWSESVPLSVTREL